MVTILEDLGKGELAGLFRDKKLVLPPQPSLGQTVAGGLTKEQVVTTARVTMGSSYISQLVCPANPPTSLARASLSYVCNSGISDQLGQTPPPDTLVLNDFKENGVFMTYAVNSDPIRGFASPSERVTSAFVSEHDGTSQTLLLSENVNASVWAVDVSSGPLAGGFYLAPKEFEQGMMWSSRGHRHRRHRQSVNRRSQRKHLLRPSRSGRHSESVGLYCAPLQSARRRVQRRILLGQRDVAEQSDGQGDLPLAADPVGSARAGL